MKNTCICTAICLLASTAYADAPLRPGLWEIETTSATEIAGMGKQPAQSSTEKFCMTIEELTMQAEGAPKGTEYAGCKYNETKSGNKVSSEVQCEDDMHTHIQGTTTLESDSAFSVDSTMTALMPHANKMVNHTKITAKRVGDCPAK